MQYLTRVILTQQCPYCSAEPGEWCSSPKSGLRSRYLHADRGRAIYEGWRYGYYQGNKDAVVELDIEGNLDRARGLVAWWERDGEL